jgi:very-short-patch-repair endonuclease
MRKEPTAAERKLWGRIRRKQIGGVKFRRQVAIDRFIVDFCSPAMRLVIEVDGPTHADTQEADVVRQVVLESHGFEVIRFQNQAVLENIDGVVQVIYEVVERKKTPP